MNFRESKEEDSTQKEREGKKGDNCNLENIKIIRPAI